jgi:alkanesulfonate monooxygenase SsuD/methylene tetrahydromethanopterin reductase-like flavin-dependent oxidoreductase (luciferase family)
LTTLILHYDLRAPDSGTPADELYAAALEQIAWADELGFHGVNLSAHHGVEDNYCPSMLTFAAAAAVRSRRIAFQVPVTLPFYDPVQVAEEFAVLDILSRGRCRLFGVSGYRPGEYPMFGVDPADRAALMEESVAALKAAWTGEEFEFRGRPVMVRPRPFSKPRPTIVLAGASRGAARRAARIADGFLGMPGFSPPENPSGDRQAPLPVKDNTWRDCYREACAEYGTTALVPLGDRIPCMYLQVAENPDEMAERVGPYLLHVANSYAAWFADAGVTASYTAVKDIDELRSTGNIQIVTPERCIEIAHECAEVMLDPLYGGIPPEIAWESLELFRTKVLPELTLDEAPGTELVPV